MRVNDIKELFDVLINMKIFKNIKFWKNSIEISPYKNLTIKVVETTYFDIYFNNFFYYSFYTLNLNSTTSPFCIT